MTPPWPVSNPVVPAVAIANARIVGPLHHHYTADDGTGAVDDRPLDDNMADDPAHHGAMDVHDATHHGAMHDVPVNDNLSVSASSIPVPCLSRRCPGHCSKEHRAGKRNEDVLELGSYDHVWSPSKERPQAKMAPHPLNGT
jgi:hypothetical protein